MTQNEYLPIIGIIFSLIGIGLSLFAYSPFWKVRKTPTDELKLYAHSDVSTTTQGYAIAELHKRKEDVSEFEGPVLKLLLSQDKHERKRGLRILEAFFPKLSDEVSFNWVSPKEGEIEEIKKMLTSRSI